MEYSFFWPLIEINLFKCFMISKIHQELRLMILIILIDINSIIYILTKKDS